MKKYPVYLVCPTLNVGRVSIVMANNLTQAQQMSLSMYPGFSLATSYDQLLIAA